MDTLTSIPASFIKDFSSLHVADLTTDEHTLLVDYIALTRDIIEANQLFEVFYFNLLNLRNSFILHSDDEISSFIRKCRFDDFQRLLLAVKYLALKALILKAFPGFPDQIARKHRRVRINADFSDFCKN